MDYINFIKQIKSMKTIIQISFLLLFSISLSAQKTSCEELMKKPLGKYLYGNDDGALVKVINQLENCGVEKYELDMSILSIFISNIAGEKGEAATVQDLYDEILIFRKQNESGEIKIRQEREQKFHKEHGATIMTQENWKVMKPLIADLYELDKMELETFANTLLEQKGADLNINYGTFVQICQKNIRDKFHLSKLAKRNATDFDYDDSFYLFPSMDYFKRRAAVKDLNGLFLVYFYSYDAVNCEKLNENTFYNPALCKLVDSNFTLITIAVDSKGDLPETHQYKQVIEKMAGKTIQNAHQYNKAIRNSIAATDTQPYFVVLDSFGHVLLKIDYEKAKDAKTFVEELKTVL